MRETILFTIIVIGMPILVSFIVEVLASVVTMEMIINFMYVILAISFIKILKEGF